MAVALTLGNAKANQDPNGVLKPFRLCCPLRI